MKKSVIVLMLFVFVMVFTGCAELEKYIIKSNYSAQEAEGQTVINAGANEAYYAARKCLLDDGLKIVRNSTSGPIILVGESYKMRSEGDRLTNTLFTNMLGGKKATESVVEKEVKSRQFIIKARYDQNWKIIEGQLGILYTGNITGINGQGKVVKTIEANVLGEERQRAMAKLKSLIAEYTKDSSKMGQ
ncbi:MAG: hypothetical protein CVV21_01075 [Candidatus Goldiibacteriota bacterium HGW-Goldbacteria-1]|nr:MAG: hypothetical protein CVV21_01075 [Candidatus Goldiibacteriota bacterium HGW-Goldbacteria-1]